MKAALIVALSLVAATACDRSAARQASALTGGDPEKGRAAIAKYGCGTCHTIPGVSGARGLVGPPLTGIASRSYLAGRLPNSPANMERWIQHPQQVDPGQVMPEMGVSARDARDIAGYLFTLR